MSYISAVILAAGESTRMKQHKLLMPWHGKTIIEHVVDNYLRSKASEIIIVLGHHAGDVTKLIGTRRIEIVINPDYGTGMSSSLTCGVNQVSKKADGLIIALADQPFTGARVINSLIESFENNRSNIIIPVYHGQRGHPVIFNAGLKNEILNITGDIGAREVINRHPSEICEVDVDSDSILHDIDTPADYAAYYE